MAKLNSFILTACITAANSAVAGPSLSLHAGAWFEGGSEYYLDQQFHSLTVISNDNRNSGGGLVPPYRIQSTASGSVSGGVLKASASTEFTEGPLITSAGAFAQWSDSFTINVAGVAVGTPLHVQYSMLVSGNTSLAYHPAAGSGPYDFWQAATSWNLNHYIGNSTFRLNVIHRDEILDNGTTTSVSTVNDQLANPYGLFTFDGWLPANMVLYTYTGLNVSTQLGRTAQVASGKAVVDLGHSTYWGGINSITLADGSVVSYSVTSESGTDYSRSFIPDAQVPEPGSLLLFPSALALLALSRRRKQGSGA